MLFGSWNLYYLYYPKNTGYPFFCCQYVATVKANQSPVTLVKSSFNTQSEISIRGSNIKEFKWILSGVIRFTFSIMAFCSGVKNGPAYLHHSRV